MLVERQAETEARTYYAAGDARGVPEGGLLPHARAAALRRLRGRPPHLPAGRSCAIARGCPSTAWCLCLASAHALQVGALFEEHAQAELFGDGDFRCAAVAAPAGSATPVDGGWELSGTQAYSLGRAVLDALHGPDVRAARGLRRATRPSCSSSRRAASGRCSTTGATRSVSRAAARTASASSRARVPAHCVLENTWMVDTDVSRGTPGSAAAREPDVRRPHASASSRPSSPRSWSGPCKGRSTSTRRSSARGRRSVRRSSRATRIPTTSAGSASRSGKTAAAEAALVQCAEQYMELCRRSVEDGIPFSREDDLRLERRSGGRR